MQAKAVRSLRVDGVCGEGGWRFGNKQRQGRGEFGDVQCLMTMLAADHVGWVCWGQVDMRGTFNLQARGDAGPDQATVEMDLGQPWEAVTGLCWWGQCVEGRKEKHHG